MKGFAINNAPTDHGGVIPATQTKDSQMGNAFVRADDGHYCPKCKCWSTVIKSHDHVIIDDKPVAYVGDKLTCGATIQPQQTHVVGDSHSDLNSSNKSNNELVENSKEYSIQYQLLDEKTSQPLRNYPYTKIIDGEKIKGVTDSNGFTEKVIRKHSFEIVLKPILKGVM